MSLPVVEIEIDNGAIGSASLTDDGIAGLILTGATVAGSGNVTVGEAHQLFSLADAVSKGITEIGSNAYAYDHIKHFYAAAGTGAELWIMLAVQTVTMEDMLDKTKLYGPVLLNAAQGKIRKLGVSRKSATGVVIANGLDADVDKAIIKGMELRTEFASLMKPFRFLVDGKDFTGIAGDLKDYRTATNNAGGVLLGATGTGKNAAVGFAIGSLAKLPVQRKLSRVKNGSLAISTAYLTNGVETEALETAWNSIHDKGYIFFRTWIGKSGYFFSSDTTATTLADDYSSFARGFVIDKAIIIAYQTYVEEIDDEVDVDDNGLISSGIIKSLQEKIENQIELLMIANGEASKVKAFIDPQQKIIQTGQLKISIGIRPVGYNSDIKILLGFMV